MSLEEQESDLSEGFLNELDAIDVDDDDLSEDLKSADEELSQPTIMPPAKTSDPAKPEKQKSPTKAKEVKSLAKPPSTKPVTYQESKIKPLSQTSEKSAERSEPRGSAQPANNGAPKVQPTRKGTSTSQQSASHSAAQVEGTTFHIKKAGKEPTQVDEQPAALPPSKTLTPQAEQGTQDNGLAQPSPKQQECAKETEVMQQAQPKESTISWNDGFGLLGSFVNDIKELGQSFSEVLQEAARESDGETETPAKMDTSIPDEAGLLNSEADALRQRALDRLTKADESNQTIPAISVSSIWGWAKGAANALAQDFSDTATEAVPALDAASRSAEFRIGQTLGSLSQAARSAQQFLEAGLNAPPPLVEPVNLEDTHLTFDELYAAFGGSQAQEDLELMSSEASRMCNRFVSSPDIREKMEDVLLIIEPLHLDLVGQVESVEKASIMHPQLHSGYSIISDMARDAIKCANSLNADSTVEEDAITLEGTKRLAEVAAVCAERLLNLGKSITLYHENGRPSNDGIHWPADALEISHVLQQQSLLMLEDLRSVKKAFSESALTEVFEAAAEKVTSCHKLLLFVCWRSAIPSDKM